MGDKYYKSTWNNLALVLKFPIWPLFSPKFYLHQKFSIFWISWYFNMLKNYWGSLRSLCLCGLCLSVFITLEIKADKLKICSLIHYKTKLNPLQAIINNIFNKLSKQNIMWEIRIILQFANLYCLAQRQLDSLICFYIQSVVILQLQSTCIFLLIWK